MLVEQEVPDEVRSRLIPDNITTMARLHLVAESRTVLKDIFLALGRRVARIPLLDA